ncbi:MAG: hypothetical protein KGH63_04750, partial [Candidatus Micrarchaeota archaeon]|nr:hypothetical protein [Candidatus Micrarchaeota archaeon]
MSERRTNHWARPLLAIILLIALAGTLGAAGTQDLVSGFVPDWAGLAAVGLAVGAALTAALYMIGEAGQYPTVKSFARAELQELIVSAVLVAVVAGALVALGVLASNMAGSALTSDRQGAGLIGYCAENCHLYPVAGATSACPGANDAAYKGALDTAASAHPENVLYADADWFLGCMPSADVSEFLPALAGGVSRFG